MTYAAETRSDTVKTKQMLNVTEMNVLPRKIQVKIRLDRVSNAEIRETCGIQHVDEWVCRRRKEWNDHVERMGPDSLVRKARDGLPKGRRSPGRHKMRWNGSLSGVTGC